MSAVISPSLPRFVFFRDCPRVHATVTWLPLFWIIMISQRHRNCQIIFFIISYITYFTADVFVSQVLLSVCHFQSVHPDWNMVCACGSARCCYRLLTGPCRNSGRLLTDTLQLSIRNNSHLLQYKPCLCHQFNSKHFYLSPRGNLQRYTV